MIFAGIMSGSSLDGVDIALVSFNNEGFKIIKSKTFPFHHDLKEQLRHSTALAVRDYFRLEQDYTYFILQCLIGLKVNHEITAIGLHGHTVVHHPELGYSIQMGNAAFLAAKAGVDVVSDFRNQDIGKGGVGTPLVPILERDLFPKHDIFINLGGICNITFFDQNRKATAFDVCPCNQTLNVLAEKLGKTYDESGVFASQGQVSSSLLKSLDALPYYVHLAPKSLDNTWVQKDFFANIKQAKLAPKVALSTMVYHIVNQLVKSVKIYGLDLKLKSCLVTGGGAFNKYLVSQIKSEFENQDISLTIPNKEIIEFKESVLMAYLAKLRIESKPSVISCVTGAEKDTIGGALYLS